MAKHYDTTGKAGVVQHGFTLIELMIVITVLSILAAIAYPNYQDYVTRSNRSDAKAMLSQVASRQEQFFLNNKSYTTGQAAVWTADTGDVDEDGSTADFVSEAGYYELGIAAGPTGSIATSYALTATAQGRQAGDTECDDFTLNSRGDRGVTGTGTVGDCW